VVGGHQFERRAGRAIPARVLDRATIEAALGRLELLAPIEQGFVAYSRGETVVPPVGELLFDDPPGDAHIKCGYIRGGEHFVVKIATGFYRNAGLGLPGNSGLMLLFSQRTGMLEYVLLEEGHLTNVRTALAGAVAARWLGPARVDRIAIFGTGLMARMQLEYLARVTPCRDVIVWGRRQDAVDACGADMRRAGYTVETTLDPARAAATANLLVTTTAATSPILLASHVQPGTHITAMGSDTPDKHELDVQLAGRADVYVADSIGQCAERGELHHALAAGTRSRDRVVELGQVIAERAPGRTAASQISIADLTGVAVQDIQIARCVVDAIRRRAATD
jgi:ornithine cyclodeaminase